MQSLGTKYSLTFGSYLHCSHLHMARSPSPPVAGRKFPLITGSGSLKCLTLIWATLLMVGKINYLHQIRLQKSPRMLVVSFLSTWTSPNAAFTQWERNGRGCPTYLFRRVYSSRIPPNPSARIWIGTYYLRLTGSFLLLENLRDPREPVAPHRPSGLTHFQSHLSWCCD